jgi:hypothetical protein
MLQLLIFMIVMFILGDPWRLLISKFTSLFKSFGILRSIVVDVFLGGFFLYAVSMIPLGLFSAYILDSVTVLAILLFMVFHRTEITSRILYLRRNPRKSLLAGGFIEAMLVSGMFFFALFVQTSPFSSLVFGSVRDTSIHSLFVQVILENRQVPLTLQPYLNEGIIYPQGFSPIAAYSTFIFNYSPPQAILYLTALFNALTILGAYYLGKTIESSRRQRLGLSLAFIFTFVAAWPKFITWGSNSFVASFPFFFICLGFLPMLAEENLRSGTVLVVGLLFGYLSVLHLQVYEMLISALLVSWIYLAIRRRKDVLRKLGQFSIIFILSLLVLSPFLVRQLSFYSYPYHNIGVLPDIEVSVPKPTISLVLTGIDSLIGNLSINATFVIYTFAVFFALVLIVFVLRKSKRRIQTTDLVKIAIYSFLGELLIFVLGAISPTNLPFYPQPLLLYFPLYFFIGAVNYPLYDALSSTLSKRMKVPDVDVRKMHKILIASPALLLLVGIYSPFIYQSFTSDTSSLYGSYNVFGVTTQQDLQLMMSMRVILPDSATVLVDSFQSGTLIPSLAQKRVVFPSCGSLYSASYQKLVGLLEMNILNSTTLDLMRSFSITDVYVGEGISSWDGGVHKFNPLLFLGNPQFSLTNRIGNAYLFHFNYTGTTTVFMEDFEHENWNQNGWQVRYEGNGLGNVIVTTDPGTNSSSLRMTSQVVCIMPYWRYDYSVFREFFVQNDSDVRFSFYLNATEGFEDRDTLAIIVFNPNANQSIIFATPNSVYADYANTRSLNGNEGSFSFDLSAEWRRLFNSTLPDAFLMEIANYDFNGIANSAFIDNIRLDSTPTA